MGGSDLEHAFVRLYEHVHVCQLFRVASGSATRKFNLELLCWEDVIDLNILLIIFNFII